MAQVKHKLEILVEVDEPVAEINNVISAFLRLHPTTEREILTQLQRDITQALEHLGGGIDEHIDN